ncbi:hydroxyacid dehydrogenase [Cohnella massiliensis]|uniref:hydroxyacid dehydrogenase n=1 Tax=Cohnella massiliensis TaxID=1816691 RepID=UPI0015940CB6|nr:hydroxyacid dehydrogenase [Cohnella massiliensis]
MKGIFLAAKSSPSFDSSKFYSIFNEYTMEKLSEIIDISPSIVDKNRLEENAPLLARTELIFSTWGFGTLSEREIREYFPRLKAVFYAAGSVKYFARPFFDCGVRVFSSQAANAVPVAEFTLAHILLANKGALRAPQRYKKLGYHAARSYTDRYEGNFNARVGLLGAGRIGRKVIELLKPFDMDVFVFDPFLSAEEAKRLGVTKAPLDIIFSTCHVISNHLADNEQTAGIVNYDYLSQMNDYTTFINTGNGPQIVTDDLVAVLKENETITAVLDVTDPEPLPADHPLFSLENAFVTARISGSFAGEVARMGEYMCEECRAFLAGEPLKYEITREMLSTLG